MPRTTKQYEAALAPILRKQEFVIARSQALASGMTPAAVKHRLAPGGPWQRLLPGVYLAVTGVPTTTQREIGALLHAGRDSVITGLAALHRHRLPAPKADVVAVLVPAQRSCKSTGFVQVCRTARMPEVICVDGAVRFAIPTRAAADAARSLTRLSDVRAVVAGAVQAGRCPIPALAGELERGPRRGSALLRRVLAEVADGIRSAVEGDLHSVLKRARLPMPMFNARLYVGTKLIAIADAWWPDAGVAAEVDSREWHLSPADWEQTLRRSAAMTAHGILVLHFTPGLIRADPAKVVAEIRSALQAGRARKPLAIRALPASS